MRIIRVSLLGIVGGFFLILSGVYLTQMGTVIVAGLDIMLGAYMLWCAIETNDPTGV